MTAKGRCVCVYMCLCIHTCVFVSMTAKCSGTLANLWKSFGFFLKGGSAPDDLEEVELTHK